MGGGGGVNVLFSLNHCFLIPKFVLGVQDENLKKSRLQDSFCVNFKSVLCQSCIFLHWFDPAPSPFDIVKKMQDWYDGASPKNDDATKVRSVEDISPCKTFV